MSYAISVSEFISLCKFSKNKNGSHWLFWKCECTILYLVWWGKQTEFICCHVIWFFGKFWKLGIYKQESCIILLQFFAGWWAIIDASSVHTGILPGYHMCGVVGTISLIMVNSVSNAQVINYHSTLHFLLFICLFQDEGRYIWGWLFRI